MTDFMSEQWSELHTHEVWKWPKSKNPINWFFKQHAIFDDAPLLETMKRICHEKSEFGRAVTVSSVDFNTGEYTTFD